jgi:hypothetical protein
LKTLNSVLFLFPWCTNFNKLQKCYSLITN